MVNQPKFAEIMMIYVDMANLVQRERETKRERDRQTDKRKNGWKMVGQ